MKNLRIQVLSDDEIRSIHQFTLEILEDVGIAVVDDEAREYFAKAGCTVEPSSNIVKIPRSLIEWAVDKAPKAFVLHGRDKGFDIMMAGDGSVTNYINLGIGTRTTIYKGDGRYEIRDSTLKDTENFATVLDACDNLAWTTQPSSAMDLMDGRCVRTLHEINAIISHTAKPFLPDPNYRYVDTYFEMVKACYGGDEEEALRRPFMIIGGTTSSPLQLDLPACQLIVRGARRGFPVMTMTMEMGGATSPPSLAGTIVLHNCEALTCVTLAQIVRAGTPVIYGTATTMFDFMNSTAPFGSPEAALLSSAISQVAQSYGLPSIATGGGSDSVHVDVQAGHESTMTALMVALSGANNVFGSGLLELGMSFSLEQLVLRNEMISMERRVLKGIEVDERTLSVEAIKEAGVGGDFMARPETIVSLSDSSKAELFNKSMYDEWQADGRDALERAHAKVLDILENHRCVPIDADARAELDRIIGSADGQL